MGNIIIKHIIEAEQVKISFNLQDGSLPFPAINLDIRSDIDLNSLLIKLTELIEIKKELEVQFEDPTGLSTNDSKIKLIKETLEEIYAKFNEKIKVEVISEPETRMAAEVSDSGDLPF